MSGTSRLDHLRLVRVPFAVFLINGIRLIIFLVVFLIGIQHRQLRLCHLDTQNIPGAYNSILTGKIVHRNQLLCRQSVPGCNAGKRISCRHFTDCILGNLSRHVRLCFIQRSHQVGRKVSLRYFYFLAKIDLLETQNIVFKILADRRLYILKQSGKSLFNAGCRKLILLLLLLRLFTGRQDLIGQRIYLALCICPYTNNIIPFRIILLQNLIQK